MKTLITNIDTETIATVVGLVLGGIITLCGIMVAAQGNFQEIVIVGVIIAIISMLITYGLIVALKMLISGIKKIIKKKNI